MVSETKRHVGRPRDPAIDRAVLDATLDVLGERGYAGFSLEAVAARAGTSKPSITRRWARRQELVIAALATVLVRPPVPNTGCTRCDLVEGIEQLVGALRYQLPAGVLAQLVADCTPYPRLHRQLLETLVHPMREAVTVTVQQGIDRGDLCADVDPELIVDVLVSAAFQSCLFDEHRFDPRRVVDVVDLMLRGAAVDPYALVPTEPATTSGGHSHVSAQASGAADTE